MNHFLVLTPPPATIAENRNGMNSNNEDNHNNSLIMPVHAAFDAFGILETILSYLDTESLLSTSAVNRQWKSASRNDMLWESACRRLWATKKVIGYNCGVASSSTEKQGEVKKSTSQDVEHRTKLQEQVEDATPLFGRIMLSQTAIEKLTSKQIWSLISYRLREVESRHAGYHIEEGHNETKMASHTFQQNIQQLLSSNINEADKKSQIMQIIQMCMPTMLGDTSTENSVVVTKGFNDIWFGSYVSSVLDSNRVLMLNEELCSTSGFDFHFKTYGLNSMDYNGLEYYATCWYETNGRFRFRINDDRLNTLDNPVDKLMWRWIVPGRALQVGSYPPVVATRKDENWGWVLENARVMMISK